MTLPGINLLLLLFVADGKTPSVEPVILAMQSHDDGTLHAVQWGGNKAIAVKPATDAEQIRKFIRAHPKMFQGYSKAAVVEQAKMRRRAARLIGENRVFTALAKLAATYVDRHRRKLGKKAARRVQFAMKIQFNYNLRYRYLLRAMNVCRHRDRIRDGKPVREGLITTVEFIRPAAPAGR